MRAKASSWKREPFAAGDASDAGAEVEEALMSSAQNQAAMDLEYGAQLLDFLISNLLLGQSISITSLARDTGRRASTL